MKLLDCTLRDGGYYNEWDFDTVIVSRYLQAISSSGVSYVELGLRNFPKKGFLGPFAYTSEEYLNSMELPSGPEYGVMIDSKTILESGLPILEAVNHLFVDKNISKISLVRIAAHFYEVEDSEEIAQLLKSKGYTVGFNLMQAAGKDSDVIASKAREISSWESVDVLYFADSLGNMDEGEVKRIVSALRREWSGELGIHTHNNMGRALDNSISAMANGVEWLDSTVTGMGRGAGNTPTENLLAVLDGLGLDVTPMPVYELAIRDFEPMQKHYGWGSNLLYFLGAQNNVHPTYVQNLLSNSHVGSKEVVGAIRYLMSEDGTNKYDGKVLEAALSLSGNAESPSGESVSGMFQGQEILIMAGGPSLARHMPAIELFVNKKKLLVIALNLGDFDEALVDYYCISHNLKFLSESSGYQRISKPVILPKHRFGPKELELLSGVERIIDYGLVVNEGELVIGDTYCTSPYDLTAIYAISMALRSGAGKIYLAGFDGYDTGDQRQSEMVDAIQKLSLAAQEDLKERIEAITPTTYPVSQGSVYAEL